MAIVNVNEPLLSVVRMAGLNFGIILVDEIGVTADVSGDKDMVCRYQGALLLYAKRNQLPIYLIRNSVDHNEKPFDEVRTTHEGAWSGIVGADTRTFSKRLTTKDETNAFANPALGQAIQDDGVNAVVIAGQSVNACCAATARGAAALGLTIYTSGVILRGGLVETQELLAFPPPGDTIMGWPDGARLCPTV